MYRSDRICFHKDTYLDKDYYVGLKEQPVINASIGTTRECDGFEKELKKAMIAVAAGANMISDHSISGDVKHFHQILREEIHVPLGIVPIYRLSVDRPDFTEMQLIDHLREVLDRGFNVLAIHATVRQQDLESQIVQSRIIPITSKGGKLIMGWMRDKNRENPYYSLFPSILKLIKKYNAALSLVPTYRPASVADNSLEEDDAYWIEVNRMAELVKMSIDEEVPIIVEGIGHAMMKAIPEYVKRVKEKCYGVPYKVLAVSTDIALGYDNISSAIASSIAVLNGADIVTAVTAAEHISLPNVQQVEDAVVSAKIAIHSARLCCDASIELDRHMSEMRYAKKTCQGSINDAIFPLGAQRALKENVFMEGCSMCGRLCALREEEENRGI